jgi:DNA-binding response OmpR family regulator
MSRILLCEDDGLISTMVALVLESEGHRVQVVSSAEEAIVAVDAAALDPFELFVLDINLPGSDGVSLATQMRGRGLGTAILMLTALDATAQKVRALDAGADDYVAKPFELPELLARVRALLRRSGPTPHRS